MKIGKYVLGILLACALLLGVHLMKEKSNLAEDIARLRESNEYLRNAVLGMEMSLAAAIEEARQETQWMSPVEISLGERTSDTQAVALSFTLGESTSKSRVTMHIRGPEDTDYVAHLADSEGDGRFTVDLLCDLPVKPTVSVHFHRPTQKGSSISYSPSEPVGSGSGYRYGVFIFDYYVTMESGDMVKTSKPASLDLEKITLGIVSPVHVNIEEIESDKGTQYSIQVHEEQGDEPFGKPSYKLVAASIAGYLDEDQVYESKLEPYETSESGSGALLEETPLFKGTAAEIPDSPVVMTLVLEYEGGKTASALLDHHFRLH